MTSARQGGDKRRHVRARMPVRPGIGAAAVFAQVEQRITVQQPQHDMPARHARYFRQCATLVGHEAERGHGGNHVKTFVREGQRQHVAADIRDGSILCACVIEHRRIVVEARHRRAGGGKPAREPAAAAADIEHAPIGSDFAETDQRLGFPVSHPCAARRGVPVVVICGR